MIRHHTNYSLLPHNTFGIDARAAQFYEYDTAADLLALISERRLSPPLLHIGQGSNLLFTADFAGTVLHSAIVGKELLADAVDSVLLRVGAGEDWDALVEWTIRQGWSGAENLSLIPGEAGAAAVQNIGAYGVEVGDLIERVEAIDLSNGELRTFGHDECHYAYRHSFFKEEPRGRWAVTHVTLRLQKQFHPHLDYGHLRDTLPADLSTLAPLQVREAVVAMRRSKLPDPKDVGSAGSFFVNPIVPAAQAAALLQTYPQMPHYALSDGRVKVPAGWLIERCGWKGRSLGRAGVYERQALVLVNRGGATGQEILTLCKAVQADVRKTFGIDIHPEVNIL